MKSEKLFVAFQHLMPRRGLTELAGQWAQHHGKGARTQAAIRWFVRRYNVDMSEALQPDIQAYANFNDFFTRALRPDARPLEPADYVCPVDGTVSQLGKIEGNQIFQAKGHHYSTRDLLGGDAALAAPFQDGHFATLYLSPRDYHRVHMPCAADLVRMIYVPGDLYSVNPATARGIEGLFARNERVVCVFESPIPGSDAHPSGTYQWCLVLVGATIVGSMATSWHGVVNPPRTHTIREWHYPTSDPQNHIHLTQGQEMGKFLLGSTVVMLFPPRTIDFTPTWQADQPVRMGQAMGDYFCHI